MSTSPSALDPPSASTPSDAQIRDQFTRYYLQRVTASFADDLDALRAAPDFDDATSLPLLVRALSQGTALFTVQDMRRVVMSGAVKGAEVQVEEVGGVDMGEKDEMGKAEDEGTGDGDGKRRRREGEKKMKKKVVKKLKGKGSAEK
jgi:hypothetical protein